MLLARKSWALALLQSVDEGKLSSKDIAVEQLRIISVHDDKQLTALVRKALGQRQRRHAGGKSSPRCAGTSTI